MLKQKQRNWMVSAIVVSVFGFFTLLGVIGFYIRENPVDKQTSFANEKLQTVVDSNYRQLGPFENLFLQKIQDEVKNKNNLPILPELSLNLITPNSGAIVEENITNLRLEFNNDVTLRINSDLYRTKDKVLEISLELNEGENNFEILYVDQSNQNGKIDHTIIYNPLVPEQNQTSQTQSQEFNQSVNQNPVPQLNQTPTATQAPTTEPQPNPAPEPQPQPEQLPVVVNQTCDYSAINQALAEINSIRVDNGKNALGLSNSITQVACNYAHYLKYPDVWSHFGASGESPVDRCVNAGTYCDSENLAYGSSASVTTLVRAWVDSPSHYAVLLGSHNLVGIGFFNGHLVANFH